MPKGDGEGLVKLAELNEYRVHPDFEPLYAENGILRGELAVLYEEYEHINRFIIPSTQTTYLIQVGALRVELLQAQINVRKTRRKIAILREHIEKQEPATQEDIDRIIYEEFKQWDERLQFESSQIENAKARFSSLSPSEDVDEIRSIYRTLSRKMNPEINGEQSEEARSFWPSIHSAYVWNDLFQLKALLMMSEDYPETYDLPSSVESMRRTRDSLKVKVDLMNRKIASARQHPAFEWRKLLDDSAKLVEEQSKLRDEIARMKVQKMALEDILKSLEMRNVR